MSGKRDTELLGENYSSARYKLTRQLLWEYVKQLELDRCFRCGECIYSLEDFSIEHVIPWRGAGNPNLAFYDTTNIRYSHLVCNRLEGAKTNGNRERAKEKCPHGHLLDDENTYWYKARNGLARQCRACRKDRDTRMG